MLRVFSSQLGLSLVLLVVSLVAPRESAAQLPSGFTQSLVAGGLQSPTTMQFAPDGRLFVLEQAGAVRIIQNGTLLPTPFITLTDVDPRGERGLLGIAFHPNFAVTPWVYLYYTSTTPSAHNRVVRVNAAGDVASGPVQTILDLENLSTVLVHNGGAMAFGPADGMLYLAVGENGDPARAQRLDTRFGKILRIDPENGTPAAGNPTSFPRIAGTTTGVYQSIWAVGLRNPYNFTFNTSGNGPAMLINDVGETRWEEINAGDAGANYGWPTVSDGPVEPNETPVPGITYPIFSYFHGQGCAIVGSAVYEPSTVTFPVQYHNRYFFADYCGSNTSPGGWIAQIDPAAPPPTTENAPTLFAVGMTSPVDVRVGDDGALYYLTRPQSTTGGVYRIQFGAGGPGITAHPSSVTVTPGQQASFTVAANGGGLSYQWQRNQVNITAATGATYAFTAQAGDNGARFRVVVTNSGGTATSNEALLTVSSNQAPVATITAPVVGTTYGGGQTIAFAGTGTDPEDGTLAGNRFTWQVDFHHATHVHPFVPATTGTTSGSFVIPNSGHTETNVWYRIYLTVTDSQGQSHQVFREVFPRVVQLTLNTVPAGRPLLLDSQPITTPHVALSVEGVIRSVGAQNHTDGTVPYTFTGWSDGGAATHNIVTPATNATYTATFGTGAVAPTAFTLAANGATVTAAWNRTGGATSYRLEVGTAAGLANLLNVDVGDVAFVQGLVPIGTYFARVRAVYPTGVSVPSTEASAAVTTTAACVAPPPVPGNYIGRSGGLTGALSWLPSAAATSYQLGVGSASGAVDVLVADLGNVTSFVGTAPAGTYFTRVRAVNACGSSAMSAEAPLVLACAPDAVVPAGLTAATGGGVTTLTWQAPLGATGYRVLVGTAPGVAVLDTPVGTVTSIAVPLAGVPAGTYYVRVAATSACGIGLPSNEVTVTVP